MPREKERHVARERKKFESGKREREKESVRGKS